MMLFMKVDMSAMMGGDKEMLWTNTIVMGIAQIVLIFITPSIVSNVVGSATLQGVSNNTTSRASALGGAAIAKLRGGIGKLF